MHIRWTFAFENSSLGVDVRDEAEDTRISDAVNSFVDLILIPSPGKDAYINLKFCKAIVREIVNEEAQITTQVQETGSGDAEVIPS